MNLQRFYNREQAGKILAKLLSEKVGADKLESGKKLVVAAIARGGVVVGAAIAKALGCSLRALVIKKIGAPENAELAIGAVGVVGAPFFDYELIENLSIEAEFLEQATKTARFEAARREKLYSKCTKPIKFTGKTVILTDDGVATGATVQAAVKEIVRGKPDQIILAVPVVSTTKLSQLKEKFSQVVVILAPADFRAVGQFYREFGQVDDQAVCELLATSVN